MLCIHIAMVALYWTLTLCWMHPNSVEKSNWSKINSVLPSMYECLYVRVTIWLRREREKNTSKTNKNLQIKRISIASHLIHSSHLPSEFGKKKPDGELYKTCWKNTSKKKIASGGKKTVRKNTLNNKMSKASKWWNSHSCHERHENGFSVLELQCNLRYDFSVKLCRLWNDASCQTITFSLPLSLSGFSLFQISTHKNTFPGWNSPHFN